jgi:hypothetical protein
VEVHNRLGWISRERDGDTVRIVTSGDSTPLRGRTTAVLRDGTAEFDSLYPPRLDYRGRIQLQVAGLPALTLPSPPSQDEVRVVNYLLNGKLVRDAAAAVRVRPGDRITGNVRLRYTTRARSLLYVLAQTTTWGVPREDTTTVRSLLAGVSDARVSVPIDVTAPMREGDFWILFTQNAEPAAIWLLSGTNWRCQQPRWNDGNDLAAQSTAFLDAGVRSGQILLPFDICDPSEYRAPRETPLAGVRVEVRR